MIRENEWLVVIDRQKVFAESDWSGWAVPDGTYYGTDANYARLADAFGDRVLYTKYVSPDPPRGSWVDYFKDWQEFLAPPTDPMFDFTDDVVQRLNGHPVLTYDTFNKWDPRVREIVGDDAYITVCGVATDFCVMQTSLHAADDGVHVRVAADACAGTDAHNHALALELMGLYAPLITVANTDDIIGG